MEEVTGQQEEKKEHFFFFKMKFQMLLEKSIEAHNFI